jgi:hypothetical protein
MVVVSPPENVPERPGHAPDPDAGVIEEARARQRRQRRIGGAVVVVAAAVLAVVVAAGGGGGSSLTGSAAQPGNQSRVTKSPSFLNASCVWQKTLSGTPTRALLSILGVLRTPAAPLGVSVLAQLERPLDRTDGAEIYTNFIRRARFFEGQPYYIAAIRFDGCGISGIKPSGDNILLWGDGGGEMGGTAQQIEAGKYVGTGGPGIAGNPHSGTVEMVVPDGVASATIHYPAGPANGFTPKIISPPVTVTATVIGNVLLFNVPRSSGGGQITHPTSMIWRNAAGAIIRTFHGGL